MIAHLFGNSTQLKYYCTFAFFYYRIEAGQTGSLQIPTLLFKENRLLSSITHELLFTIAINNGDLFVADGTKIIVEEI